MAAGKEAMIIILDVGKNALRKSGLSGETFFDQQKDCCLKILQRKIFSSKKDEVGLLLLGTSDTDNELNRSMDGYENISELSAVGISSWNTVHALERGAVYEGAAADWLDALIVAISLLKREMEVKKFANLKIVLFTTFSTYVNDDNVSFVIQGLKKMDVELVVISDGIQIQDNDTNDPESVNCIFSQDPNKSQHQKDSEKLIHKIIEETDGNLCSFDYAITHLLNFQRKKSRPWYWYSSLKIGSAINIQIAATILIKEETHIKWTTVSAHENMISQRTIETFVESKKVDLDKENMIVGYMIGATPIAYDPSLGNQSTPTEKGISCFGFCPTSDVPHEFYSGNGTYLVLPKKDQNSSEKMFFALVNAMSNMNMVMIATRVFSNGHKPKLIVLRPVFRNNYPCLCLNELFFSEQYLSYSFPLLNSKKSEPSAEQLAAIEDLMDSMDLMDASEENDLNGTKEAFPQNNLLNISLQYIFETIGRRALHPKEPVQTLDKRLSEALKIPLKIMENSKEPLERVKSLFELNEIKKPEKKKLLRYLVSVPPQPEDVTDVEIPDVVDVRNLIEVGTVTPAEDFIILFNRGESFSVLGKQIQTVISDLIFKSMTEQTEKIAKAIFTYREESKLHAPYHYNEWVKGFRETLVARKKVDFWKNVFVAERCGLISSVESELVSSVTEEEAAAFYEISTTVNSSEKSKDDGEEAEDLFDLM